MSQSPSEKEKEYERPLPPEELKQLQMPTSTYQKQQSNQKVYVCYLLEGCEGTYLHATTMDPPRALNFSEKKPIIPDKTWIAFADKEDAIEWVEKQKRDFGGLPYFDGVDYKEVELVYHNNQKNKE